MTHRQLRIGYFTLEAITAFATSYYFNYLFFFAQRQFGFSNLDNLALSALNGFVYMSAAWYGGRFGEKHGYCNALTVGFSLMAAAMLCGWCHQHLAAHVAGMMVWTVGMCFSWPNLEALACEAETRAGLTQMVGIYNAVWATGAALAFFIGGALIDHLGWSSMFWLPASLHVVQLALLWRLKQGTRTAPAALANVPAGSAPGEPSAVDPGPALPADAQSFLRMAWLANPFAYIAINTAIPLIPSLANHFGLTPTLAGFFCSAWMFARLGAFLVLWRWTGWHYRFRWLLAAYLLLIVSFIALLLAVQLWTVVVAQVVFGWAVGLTYYSSLFYSMDTSETKGVHGGVHESAIGLGIFAGPAVGATAVRCFPQYAHASTWAVSGILLLGLSGLLWLRLSRRRVSR